MKKYAVLTLVFVSLILTIGCQQQTSSATPKKEVKQVNSAKPEELFRNNCTRCHGGNLEGNIGPNLQHVGSELSKDQIFSILTTGRGRMPSWQARLSDQERNDLATWLSGKK